MSETYQRVEPTPFSAQQPDGGSAAAASPPADRMPWRLPALAVLALLAVAVVFLLPGWVADRPPSAPSSAQAPAATAQGAEPAAVRRGEGAEAGADAASPFADAVEAKARAQAQDLLAELLDVQENLRQRGAESWASEEMAAVAARALSGDEYYRARDFDAAIADYEAALDAALALEGSLGERFETQVAATRDAVEALEGPAATASLELARLLQPDNAVLVGLSSRVNAVPEVAQAMTDAAAAEAAADLETAVAALDAATEQDPQHQYLAGELQRLRAALNEQRFGRAMSEGYAALDDGAFQRAQARFERAGKLKPGSGEAAAALLELSVARTAAQLRQLQNRGEQLLAEEDWSAAISAFEEALGIDAGLRFAREGLAFARPRAALDSELSAIIDEPGRLVDDAILREARQSLQEAQALDDIGPRLGGQINAVRDIIAVASRPVAVRLTSDGATEVTVYKVARLGLFEQRQLELRPGRYTAVGRRRGYRDVRVEFTVPADGGAVYIACSETI